MTGSLLGFIKVTLQDGSGAVILTEAITLIDKPVSDSAGGVVVFTRGTSYAVRESLDAIIDKVGHHVIKLTSPGGSPLCIPRADIISVDELPPGENEDSYAEDARARVWCRDGDYYAVCESLSVLIALLWKVGE